LVSLLIKINSVPAVIGANWLEEIHNSVSLTENEIREVVRTMKEVL